MSKKKMSEKELLKLELIEVLRLLGEIVMEGEPEELQKQKIQGGKENGIVLLLLILSEMRESCIC